MKNTLKVVEQDITKLKRKIKRYQREGKFDQVQWRKNLLTKLKRKATLIYAVLEAENKLRKEWNSLT
jgi:hypothetical protein